MAVGRKASVTQSKLGFLIYGEQFTGKSTLASQFVYFKRPDGKPFRVLYIDAESGSIDDYIEDFEKNGINPDNLYIVYTQSLGEVRELLDKIKNNEDFHTYDEYGEETDEIVLDSEGKPFRADAVVVDGATVLNLTVKQGLVEFSRKRNSVKAARNEIVGDARIVMVEGAGLELKDYQTINFKGQDLVLALQALGIHFAITAREADEKQQVTVEENGKKKVTSVPTGRKIPDGFKGMEYNVKTVIWTYTDEDGQICAEIKKDRTGVHKMQEIVEDPTILDWQSVIDRTSKRKSFVVSNNLQNAVNKESDIYEKEIAKSSLLNTPENEPEKTAKSNTKSPAPKNNADSVRKEIISIIKSLSPVDKQELKKDFISKGLPDTFSKVTDMEILNKVLEAAKQFVNKV